MQFLILWVELVNTCKREEEKKRKREDLKERVQMRTLSLKNTLLLRQDSTLEKIQKLSHTDRGAFLHICILKEIYDADVNRN